MVKKIAETFGVSSETVWKVALGLLGYLVMGVWITARISERVDILSEEVKMMRGELHQHIFLERK